MGRPKIGHGNDQNPANVELITADLADHVESFEIVLAPGHQEGGPEILAFNASAPPGRDADHAMLTLSRLRELLVEGCTY